MKELLQQADVFLSGSEAGWALKHNNCGGEGFRQRARQFPRIAHDFGIAKSAALGQLIGGKSNLAVRPVIVRVRNGLKRFERELEICGCSSAPSFNCF